jgi:hypothetical protein
MRFSRRFDLIAALLLVGAAPALAQTNKSGFYDSRFHSSNDTTLWS